VARKKLLARAPGFSMWLTYFEEDGERVTYIAMGYDGVESFSFGPYPGPMNLPDALRVVATTLQMDDQYQFLPKFDLSRLVHV
jgi:hypothetical protein